MKCVIIGSGNGPSPIRRQTIITHGGEISGKFFFLDKLGTSGTPFNNMDKF